MQALLAAALLLLAVCLVGNWFVTSIDEGVVSLEMPAWPWLADGEYRLAEWVTWLARVAGPLAALGAAVWLLAAPRRAPADVAGVAVALGVGGISLAAGTLGARWEYDPWAISLLLGVTVLIGLAVAVLATLVIARSRGPLVPGALRYPAAGLSVLASLITAWVVLSDGEVSMSLGYLGGTGIEVAALLVLTLLFGGAGQFGFLLMQLQLGLFSLGIVLYLSVWRANGLSDDGREWQVQVAYTVSAVLVLAAFVVALIGRLRARPAIPQA